MFLKPQPIPACEQLSLSRVPISYQITILFLVNLSNVQNRMGFFGALRKCCSLWLPLSELVWNVRIYLQKSDELKHEMYFPCTALNWVHVKKGFSIITFCFTRRPNFFGGRFVCTQWRFEQRWHCKLSTDWGFKMDQVCQNKAGGTKKKKKKRDSLGFRNKCVEANSFNNVKQENTHKAKPRLVV